MTQSRNYRENGYVCIGLALYLNPFLVACSLDNPVDVDARYVDVLFGEGPNIHHLLHLRRHTEWWAPLSPVKCLTTIEIKKVQIRKPHAPMELQKNNLCLPGYEI